MDTEPVKFDLMISQECKSMNNNKTICLCHDIEGGLGHTDSDAALADSANKSLMDNLLAMLAIEREMNIKATYHVVGLYIDKLKQIIEKDGHCLSFHSYDHVIDKHWLYSNRKVYATIKPVLGILINKAYKRSNGQLEKCRKLDSKIEGYRPPRSIITLELTDENLNFHNFQWLASSAQSLGLKNPKVENGIVKIPILFNDFGLYDKKLNYEKWEKKAIGTIMKHDFTCFCLHDCYAQYWLPFYKAFLERINELGKFKTLDEVANELKPLGRK